MDAIAAFAEHVVRTSYDDLPDDAVAAAKTLILDTLGVGVVGSAGPWVGELIRTASGWGRGEGCPRLGPRRAAAGAGRGALQRLSDPQLRVRLHP